MEILLYNVKELKQSKGKEKKLLALWCMVKYAASFIKEKALNLKVKMIFVSVRHTKSL